MSQMDERLSPHTTEECMPVEESQGESAPVTVVRTVALDRARIEKGQRVLKLCIEEGKLLCVKGFIDSQIEKGGSCREVLLTMREFVDGELGERQDRKKKEILRDLQSYLVEALR